MTENLRAFRVRTRETLEREYIVWAHDSREIRQAWPDFAGGDMIPITPDDLDVTLSDEHFLKGSIRGLRRDKEATR